MREKGGLPPLGRRSSSRLWRRVPPGATLARAGYSRTNQMHWQKNSKRGLACFWGPVRICGFWVGNFRITFFIIFGPKKRPFLDHFSVQKLLIFAGKIDFFCDTKFSQNLKEILKKKHDFQDTQRLKNDDPLMWKRCFSPNKRRHDWRGVVT